MQDIQALLQTGDSFAAVEHIQRTGTPLEIAARYEALLLDFYWKAHDLPAVITFGRAGILYCLGQSLTGQLPPDTAKELRSIAKGLAYNVGSFAWPGWEEPGIHPTPADLAFGADCARLNLRLAIELQRPPKGLSKAHWLMGAHALAAEDFAWAEREFQAGHNVLAAADTADPLNECNRGYVATARLGKKADDAEAAALFDEVIGRLQASHDKDAADFVPQLMTARRIFAAGPVKT